MSAQGSKTYCLSSLKDFCLFQQSIDGFQSQPIKISRQSVPYSWVQLDYLSRLSLKTQNLELTKYNQMLLHQAKYLRVGKGQ